MSAWEALRKPLASAEGRVSVGYYTGRCFSINPRCWGDIGKHDKRGLIGAIGDGDCNIKSATLTVIQTSYPQLCPAGPEWSIIECLASKMVNPLFAILNDRVRTKN